MLKIATMGTSQITHSFIDATQYVNHVDVVAVFSRNEDTASSLAKKFSISTHYTNLADMLTDSGIDCVYVATPNTFHFDHVMQCLKKKKHVICEKPMFMTVDEWSQAYEEADRQGVYLFEAMRNLHTPNFKKLAESLNQVGKVRSVYLHRIRYSSKYDAFLQGEVASVFSKEMGGGALRDLGVYPLSLVIALFGAPNSSTYFPVRLHTGVDGSGTLVLEYDEFNCVLMCSKLSTSYNYGEFQGEKGTLIIDNPAPISQIQFQPIKDESQLLKTEEPLPNMSYQIENFARMILERDEHAYHYYRDISKQVVSIVEGC
ncbi:Gfo/Idh/MocA family protein [Alkalibacillus aidingensis]|uniref:Gfo/Idh/MocA family protein n=1 Tax=Alkalibacillus aidingensis TaxID=2747607 RepID=UPI0016611934|nr:Gfo/Idh/MocA family oxidoreductase [Alkalibacillus aidingensis]